MATDTNNMVARFNSLSTLPATRQLSLLFGLAASIAIGVGLAQWSVKPDYTPLFGELSPAHSGEIIQSLEAAGMEHQVNNRTGMISVAADRVHEARLKLASEGLPRSDGSGYDMLYQEQEMGLSSFMEKARYDRALEQELARSITSLESVRSARVHLALPKASAFLRKRDKPAASVLLSLYAGRQLTERQLAGVVHLVASSVPSLEAEQVSVVDNQGKLLSGQGEDSDLGYTKEQFNYTQQLERRYVQRITEILSPILGVEAVRAQVAADIDFTRVEKTSEVYAPEASLRSEQTVEELSRRREAGGVPGTLSNEAPMETEVSQLPPGSLAEATEPTRSSTRQTRNYELDKTISHIREATGNLKKLSVAVVVDHVAGVNEAGKAARVPLSAERLAEINALVREAVGFSEARGDSVNVTNASFVVVPELESMPAPSLFQQEWLWRAAKLLLVAVVMLVLVFSVVRPLMRMTPSLVAAPQALGGPAAQASADTLMLGEDQVTLGSQRQGLPAATSGYQQQLEQAQMLVADEPHRAAHVVKGWVAKDG